MVTRALAIAIAVAVAIGATGVGTYLALGGGAPPAQKGGVIPVVAAENFWGSLIAQVGGTHVSVTSIVTDPNADPHDYESNPVDARAVASARLVIENGAGYDDWCTQLLSAGGLSDRVVLNVANLLGLPAGVNPHFWYNPAYVNLTVHQMYADLLAVDPGDSGYFQKQYSILQTSLGQLYGHVAEIKRLFAGTPVASTESIFVYLANATGLDLVSPPAFMDAVAEGNDPPAQSVVQFQNQLESGSVQVLVYNQQTVTPLTTQMKNIAVLHNVSLVGVTETIQPPDFGFQAWMTAELGTLQNALNQQALSR
jgi:zinc/manganese transport system substrate-binding protein